MICYQVRFKLGARESRSYGRWGRWYIGLHKYDLIRAMWGESRAERLRRGWRVLSGGWREMRVCGYEYSVLVVRIFYDRRTAHPPTAQEPIYQSLHGTVTTSQIKTSSCVLPFICDCRRVSSHGQCEDDFIAAITATKTELLPCIIGNLQLITPCNSSTVSCAHHAYFWLKRLSVSLNHISVQVG